MTEQPAAPAEEMDWSDVEQSADGASFPELPDNPHNHLLTISMDSRGPMIVVRANTPQEANARWQALADAGTLTLLSALYAQMKGAPAPAPQAAPAAPQGAAQQFPQPAQQFPGQPGTAPAAWQNVGAPTPPAWGNQGGAQDSGQEYKQAGWYRLNVPFPKKGAFDGICAQYQFRKGRPSEGGQYSWNKGAKAWFCSPDIAGAFGQFSPVPA